MMKMLFGLLRFFARNYENALLKFTSLYYRTKIVAKCPTASIGKNFNVYGKMQVNIAKTSVLKIDNNVTFKNRTKYNYVGISRPSSIYTCEGTTLLIGENTGISGAAIFVAEYIKIGNNCNIGGNTAIWDTDFHPIDPVLRRINDLPKTRTGSIIIGDDVFVGGNSIILKGVSIGDRSVIGAGSVVTKSIPADEIWGGNPAKFIRKLYK